MAPVMLKIKTTVMENTQKRQYFVRDAFRVIKNVEVFVSEAMCVT